MAKDEEYAEFGEQVNIAKLINDLKLSFDTHHGIVCLVHFSEQGKPIMASEDKTTELIHVIGEFHKFHTQKKQGEHDNCIKLTKPNGKGLAIVVEEAIYPPKENWFEKYLELTNWIVKEDHWLKNGKILKILEDDNISISTFSDDITATTATITYKIPRNEIEAKNLWYFIGL